MKRIAMIMPGGVTRSSEGVHIPSLYRFVEKLSDLFDITVYSLVTLEPEATESICGNARVVILGAHHQHHWSKKIYQYVSSVFLDQKKRYYELIHGMLGLNAEFATVVLGKILRIPSVVSLFGGETVALPSINYGTLNRRIPRRLMSWVCRNASTLTVQTTFQEAQLKTMGVKRNDLRVIPRGVDTTKFFPDGRVNYLGPPYRFLHVANLHEVKDQITLVRAFAQVSRSVDCSMRIIGEGSLRGTLQQLARDLGVAEKIEFLGWVDYNELPQHYRWAHVLLHSSLHESQAMVVAEAAACGTVVCGTRVGLIHDLGEDKALAVSPGDYKGLAEKVIHILTHRDSYYRLRGNALEWAALHNMDWSVRMYKTVYDESSQES